MASISTQRLLFVDDDVEIQRSFVLALRGSAYQIDLASTSKEAMALARRHNYSIVVTDYRLADDNNGLDVISGIRAINRSVAFVMVTGETLALPKDCHDADQILEIVYKPWEQESLLATLLRASDQARRRCAALRLMRLEKEEYESSFDVLLLEDDDADGRLVEATLRRSDIGTFCVRRANRLDEGLALLRTHRFDLILVDLGLPDARGLTSVALVGAEAPGIPIVVVSGQDDRQVALQAIRLGAQDYVVKGNTGPDHLVRAVLFAIERYRTTTELQRRAHYNDLTGLPNRSLFRDLLRRAFRQKTCSERSCAVLFIDLDGFKVVNDSLGHDAGDELLRQVGARISRSCRECDTPAHLSGDEFAVIIEDTAGHEAYQIAQRVLRSIGSPYDVGGETASVTASVGLAYASRVESIDDLLREADTQMYRAKHGGKNKICSVALDRAQQAS